jgi:hypothetical protein
MLYTVAMHIETLPGNSHKALVIFEDKLERLAFGDNAPFFSTEHLKTILYAAHGNPYPEEFPQTAEIRYRVIGHVAGKLATRDPVIAASWCRDSEASVITAVTEHFTELRDGYVELSGATS